MNTLLHNGMLICPFCHDTDFDDVGLKIHLTQGHCPIFETTEIIDVRTSKKGKSDE